MVVLYKMRSTKRFLLLRKNSISNGEGTLVIVAVSKNEFVYQDLWPLLREDNVHLKFIICNQIITCISKQG
jgi:hypothetical protein